MHVSANSAGGLAVLLDLSELAAVVEEGHVAAFEVYF